MNRIFFFLIVLSSTLFSQVLKEIEVKPTENRGAIPVFTEFPDKAGIYFYTKFDNATFHSNYGIYKTYDRGPGNYVIIIEPSRQSIEVRIPGYKTEIIKIQDMHPRDVLFYTVEPKKEEEGVGGVKELAVTVVASPSSAEIQLDGKLFKCDTPTIVSIGEHSLKISKAGFQTISTTIVVSTSNNLFKYNLQPIIQQPYTFMSTPKGASIEINGVAVAQTDTVLNLPEGTHHVKLSKPGYITEERDIAINPEVTSTLLSCSLTKNAGTIKFFVTPSEAEITIGNQRVKNGESVELSPNKYIAEIKALNYITEKRDIQVELGKEAIVNVELKKFTGTLIVNSALPEIMVKINNNLYQNKRKIELSPANYTVEVSSSNYRTMEYAVSIQTAHDTTLNVELLPLEGGLFVSVSPLDSKCSLIDNNQTLLQWQGAKNLTKIKAGTYTLQVSREDYKTTSKQITVLGDTLTSIEIVLKEKNVSDVIENVAYKPDKIRAFFVLGGALPIGDFVQNVATNKKSGYAKAGLGAGLDIYHPRFPSESINLYLSARWNAFWFDSTTFIKERSLITADKVSVESDLYNTFSIEIGPNITIAGHYDEIKLSLLLMGGAFYSSYPTLTGTTSLEIKPSLTYGGSVTLLFQIQTRTIIGLQYSYSDQSYNTTYNNISKTVSSPQSYFGIKAGYSF